MNTHRRREKKVGFGSRQKGIARRLRNRCTDVVIAFTLIEMIGSLAVIAILASMLLPVIVRQIDRAAWTAEAANVGSISNAIVMQVLRNKTVSSTNTWASDAALWTGLPTTSITTNPRRNTRAFLMDSSGWLGSTTLPYVQTNTGTTVPTSA